MFRTFVSRLLDVSHSTDLFLTDQEREQKEAHNSHQRYESNFSSLLCGRANRRSLGIRAYNLAAKEHDSKSPNLNLINTLVSYLLLTGFNFLVSNITVLRNRLPKVQVLHIGTRENSKPRVG